MVKPARCGPRAPSPPHPAGVPPSGWSRGPDAELPPVAARGNCRTGRAVDRESTTPVVGPRRRCHRDRRGASRDRRRRRVAPRRREGAHRRGLSQGPLPSGHALRRNRPGRGRRRDGDRQRGSGAAGGRDPRWCGRHCSQQTHARLRCAGIRGPQRQAARDGTLRAAGRSPQLRRQPVGRAAGSRSGGGVGRRRPSARGRVAAGPRSRWSARDVSRLQVHPGRRGGRTSVSRGVRPRRSSASVRKVATSSSSSSAWGSPGSRQTARRRPSRSVTSGGRGGSASHSATGAGSHPGCSAGPKCSVSQRSASMLESSISP